MTFFREAEARGSCKHCGEVRWSHDPDTAECPPPELGDLAADAKAYHEDLERRKDAAAAKAFDTPRVEYVKENADLPASYRAVLEQHVKDNPITAATINPKDALGAAKVPLSLVPAVAIIHAAEAFRDGIKKHGGSYNWREKKVKASDCVDAAMRHILSWFDGEEFAVDSGVHHLGHAIARLAIILDAYEVGALVDDRPTAGVTADLLFGLHREHEAEEKAAEYDRDLELDDEIPF